MEREILEAAVAQHEAEPDEIRAAGAIVVAGDGWHEGVVGIVAARLVERFERPAIVIARAGESAKGSGRSMPGVDLHALVGAASGPLTRWGGHAGAVGLELPAAAVARFRDALLAAAEGARAAIARARVRRVDAVVGRPRPHPRDGRGDRGAGALRARQPVGAAGRARGPSSSRRRGWGRASTCRCGCAPAASHARAIGFRMGERASALDLDERHDAVITLDVERWQGLVGPRVTVEALEELRPPRSCRPSAPSRATCAARTGCRSRGVRALLDDAPHGPARPRGRGRAPDRRARPARRSARPCRCSRPWRERTAGSSRSCPTSPAGARPWRRRSSRGASAPRWRCWPAGAATPARWRPAWRARAACRRSSMVDYARLAEVEPPEGMHLALVDPPASPLDAAWAARRAAGRWLHLAWSEPEAELALAVAEEEWELRPAVTAIWRALRGAGPLALGPRSRGAPCSATARPCGRPGSRPARWRVLRGARASSRWARSGVRAAADPARRELDDSPLYRACRARLEEARAFLALAPTLDLLADPADRVPVGA